MLGAEEAVSLASASWRFSALLICFNNLTLTRLESSKAGVQWCIVAFGALFPSIIPSISKRNQAKSCRVAPGAGAPRVACRVEVRIWHPRGGGPHVRTRTHVFTD